MLNDSILNSVKKNVGVDESMTAFDYEIITLINSAFSTLNQLGIGPVDGFMIEDDTATWDSFLAGDPRFNSIRTYMSLKVRLAFDPPGTSFAIAAMEKQIEELEWRLNTVREGDEWVNPNPPPDLFYDEVI